MNYKNILLSITFLMAVHAITLAQKNVNIPDANFKKVLLANSAINTNGDKQIQISEAQATDSIDVSDKNISRLVGIEAFTALTYLNCGHNNLVVIDISKNIALTTFLIYRNYELSTLDVSKNTALTYLDCSINKLSILDVSKNTALTYLDCGQNPITTLYVGANTALTYLDCRSYLTTLDVSKNTALTYLDCSINRLSVLDVSKNTALTYLACSSTSLTTLDISKNTALIHLNCKNTRLAHLDVSKNTALIHLDCSLNNLTTLDVSKNTALTYLDCSSTALTTLDVSKNISLTTLKCGKELTKKIAEKRELDAKLNFTGKYDGHLYHLDKNPILFDCLNKRKANTNSPSSWTTEYKGEMINGLPIGYGIYTFKIVKYGSMYDQEYVCQKYTGYWKDGLFEGQGKLIERYDALQQSKGQSKVIETYSPFYLTTYEGEWRNNLYHGRGTSMEYVNDGIVHFLQCSGNFVEGKREGNFEVIGQYKDQLKDVFSVISEISGVNWYEKFHFKLEVVYENDIEISKKVIIDEAKKMDDYYDEIIRSRQAAAQRYNELTCSNCEIYYEKSTYPREEEDNVLWWSETSHKNGTIIMMNGDKHYFDYEDGKWKVINGIFATDDYYNNFKAMIDALLSKCKKKYCK